MHEQVRIPKRILGNLLNSAGAGVVPRQGLEYVAIGREQEIAALSRDLDNLSEGMGAFRLIVGKYGSGKSFLMGLMRCNAQERGFVTADTDLTPERRFQGTHGQGLAAFRDLMQNLSTKAMPDGNALSGILENWFASLQTRGITENGLLPDSTELKAFVTKEIFAVAERMRSFAGGFDFAKAIYYYYDGTISGNDALREDALRWLRGEFEGKLQSRASEVRLNSVIDDQNWFDYLKLYALFFRAVGYRGLILFFDELVNLYKIPNRVSRENNYEKILSVFNDTMQGKAEGLGVFMGATPQMVEDPRRGLFSYEALKSRLMPGRFLSPERQTMSSPLIHLKRLTDDELFALCRRLVLLHSSYNRYTPKVGDGEITAFLKQSLSRMGASEMITPREITRDFLNLLDVMYTDPETDFFALLGETGKNAANEEKQADNDDFFDISEIKL